MRNVVYLVAALSVACPTIVTEEKIAFGGEFSKGNIQKCDVNLTMPEQLCYLVNLEKNSFVRVFGIFFYRFRVFDLFCTIFQSFA